MFGAFGGALDLSCITFTSQAALDATAFLIDWLKTRAPFWKQEELADGGAHWVEARAADDDAAARWDGETRSRRE